MVHESKLRRCKAIAYFSPLIGMFPDRKSEWAIVAIAAILATTIIDLFLYSYFLEGIHNALHENGILDAGPLD